MGTTDPKAAAAKKAAAAAAAKAAAAKKIAAIRKEEKQSAPKTGGGTTPPKDNAKTKTFAKNAGVKTMTNLGSNNATVVTKGGRTELATYYQGRDKSGSTVTVPNKTFAGKTTAQVDSIANTMGVPKGGFKKVTTSTYRSNESMKTPKGTVTLKKPAKVTAKK
jgi:hypothetical protein